MPRSAVLAAALALAPWAAVALGATACRDAQLDQLESVRAEVCACKTPACATAALQRVPQRDVRSNARSQKVAKAIHECVAKAYAADRPTLDPDEAVPLPPEATAAP